MISVELREKPFYDISDEKESIYWKQPCSPKDAKMSMAAFHGCGRVLDVLLVTSFVSERMESSECIDDGISFLEYFRDLIYRSGISESKLAMSIGFHRGKTNLLINGQTKTPPTIAILTFAIALRLPFEETIVLLWKTEKSI